MLLRRLKLKRGDLKAKSGLQNRLAEPPVLFVLSQKRNYTHTRMNSFGQQLPSQRQIKPEPESGNHQMPPTLPRSIA